MYNEFSNMDSVDLMGIVRNMDYHGYDIHYYTGICKDEVYISLADILEIISRDKGIHLMDVDNVLIKAGVIPNHVKNKRSYFIESYINNQCTMYPSVIKVCEYYGMKELKTFLVDAVKMINDIGVFIDGLKYKYNNRRKNKEMNVSDLLRQQDLEKFYNNCENLRYDYNLDSLYFEVVDRISFLVFNCSMYDLREDKNLYMDQKVSDFISDSEYNKLCVASKVFSYMMGCNQHLGLEYIEYLANEILEMKCSDNNTKKNITTGEFEEETESLNPYIDTFKRLGPDNDYDYNDDIDDFTRYM